MSTERISAIDVASGNLVPMSSNPPVSSSALSGWNGIQVEQHRIPASESPELELQHHSISIQLGQPFEIDWRLAGGRLQTTQMSRGDVSVTPNRIPTFTRWHNSVEFLLLSINPTLVERAASQLTDTGLVEITPARGVRAPQLQYIGLALLAELETGCLSGRLYGESLATALAVHLVKRYSTSRKPIREPAAGFSKRQLQQVIDDSDNLLVFPFSNPEIY